MGIPNLPEIPPNPSTQQLAQIVGALTQELTYLLSGFLSSDNAREFGGYIVGKTELQSKDKKVGISSNKNGADPIRFWAGDTIAGSPPFYVTESGKMYATDGYFTGIITGSTITGGTVRSGADGSDRIELSSGKFRGITSSGTITGLYFDIGTYAGTGIADIFFYHNGTKLLQMYDEITNYRISGIAGGWMNLGSASTTTNASGQWDFGGATISGLSFSYSGVTDPGGTDGHTHTFTVSGSVI